MSSRILGRLVAVAVFTVMWLALWRDLSVGFVISGLVVSAAVAFGAGPAGLVGGATLRPWPTLIYLTRFVRDLIVASAVIVWEVITPTDRTRTGIVAVPIVGGSDIVTTIVANTISLVPGTLTLDVRRDPAMLYVHVLHLRDPDEVRADIQLLERRAMRAFGRRPVEPGSAAAATPPVQERP
jgi:multicomponent Na+:H+ antiporter subunit E